MNSATLQIAIEVDDKGSVKIRDLGRAAKDAGDAGEKSMGGFRERLNQVHSSAEVTASTLAGIAAIGFATAIGGLAALSAKMVEAVKAASDLNETTNKFNTVFAGMTSQATTWAADLQSSYGMSKNASMDMLASLQVLNQGMGMSQGAAGQLSSDMIKLAVDLGSFNNLPTVDVLEAMRSAIVGEYDPIQRFAGAINAATVEQKALAMGLAKTKDEITAADKAQAMYQLVLESNTVAVGDFIKTSDGLANQTKVFQSNIEDLSAAFGARLLPVAADVMKKINEGLTEGEGGVDGLSETISVKLLQALGMAVETMRFFHNGWLGIKLVGTLAVDAIAHSLEVLFKGLRASLVLFDLAFDGMVALGGLKVNPFDNIEKSLGTFSASSRDVTGQVMADIAATNASYDTIKATIDGYVEKVKTSAVEESAAAQTIQSVHKETGNVVTAVSEKIRKEQEKAATEREKLSLDLTGKIKEATLSEYEYKVWALDQETAKMREKYAGDQTMLDQITAYEKTKLAEINSARELTFEEEYRRQMAIDAGRRTSLDTFMVLEDLRKKGGSETSRDITRNCREELSEMEKAWRDFGRDIKSDFTATLGDFLRGEFTSLGDAWEALTDRLLDSFINMIAEMVVAWATSEIYEFWTGNESGFSFSGMFAGGSAGSGSGGAGAGAVTGIAGELVKQKMSDVVKTEVMSYFASDAGAAAAASTSTNLLEGTATPAIMEAYANSQTTTAGSLLSTAGGVIGVAGGAYGMYSGINNLKEGNYAVGGVQTALGGYSTYQGGVTLGMIESGTATAAYDSAAAAMSSYFSGAATTEAGAAIGTAAGEAFAANAAADAAGTYAASATAAEFGTTAVAAEGAGAGTMGGMAAASGPAAIVAMLAMWAAMDIADQGRNKTRDKLNESRISPTGFGMVSGVGTEGELTRLSEEARDSIYLLNNAFGEIDAVSIDAAAGVMVLANNIVDENGLITGINYGIETFDNASGAWVKSQVSFSDLLDTMSEMGPVSSDAIATTSSYVAEMAGVPSVADELAIAFTELQTGIYGVAGAAVSGAGTFATAVAMMQGAASGINWSGGNNVPWEDQSNPDVQGSQAWVAAGGGSPPVTVDDGWDPYGGFGSSEFGHATGGTINRLIVPRGDDGLAGYKYGEVVLPVDTSQLLARKLKDGSLDGGATAQAIVELKEVIIGAIMASSDKMRRIENTILRWEKTGLPGARA